MSRIDTTFDQLKADGRKALIPFVPCPGLVTAVTTKISPTEPCVMNRLVPFRR